MDWRQIEKDYPKASEACYQYFNDKEEPYGPEPFRELYDFFDEQKLFVHLDHETYRNGVVHWFWRIWGKWRRGILAQKLREDFDTKHRSRLAAEAAAFENAFELLEAELK